MTKKVRIVLEMIDSSKEVPREVIVCTDDIYFISNNAVHPDDAEKENPRIGTMVILHGPNVVGAKDKPMSLLVKNDYQKLKKLFV